MSKRRRRSAHRATAGLGLALLLMGCSASQDDTTATSEATEVTESPDTTEPSDDGSATTAVDDEPAPADPAPDEPDDEGSEDGESPPPDDGDTDEAEVTTEPDNVPLWAWIASGVLVAAALVWTVTRVGTDSDLDTLDPPSPGAQA